VLCQQRGNRPIGEALGVQYRNRLFLGPADLVRHRRLHWVRNTQRTNREPSHPTGRLSDAPHWPVLGAR